MPALVNSNVGSLRGTSGLDGTISCPLRAKYSRNAERMSLVVCMDRFWPSAAVIQEATRGYRRPRVIVSIYASRPGKGRDQLLTWAPAFAGGTLTQPRRYSGKACNVDAVLGGFGDQRQGIGAPPHAPQAPPSPPSPPPPPIPTNHASALPP